MNAVERFFRHYILSTVGILALFLCVNLALSVAFFAFIYANGVTDRTFSIERFSNHITYSETGFEADADVLDALHEADAWAMILDDNGTVVWETNLPSTLPRTYTLTDVAMFSRWYLEDYPVRIWNRTDGLLVVGFQPGSLSQLYLSFETASLHPWLLGVVGIIVANITLLIVLFLRNTRRLEKAVEPILNGIRALSHGNSLHLEEKGELAEINAGLNRASDYLKQKDNTRAEWIRGVSHDMRTPLAVILGYASEMADTDTLSPTARKQAEIICRQSEQMRELIDSLNLTTRLEYAMYPVKLQSVNAVELTRQVVIDLLNDGLSPAYEITFSTDEGTIPINGDPALLHRMVSNLIRNSIVHNPQGCTISISVVRVDNACVFSVSDNGCGVSEPQLRSLNDTAIKTVQQEQSHIGQEHGLGLKIVRQIVKAHSGKIVFSNASPHGLCVIITLPGG